MAMGKRTVNSLGALGVVAILGGIYFGIVGPVLSQKAAAELELQQAQTIGQGYSSKLLGFQNGESEETRAATATMEQFQSLVSESIDIESASRAIAASLPEGVKLESFNFGGTQQVSSLQSTPLAITGFTPPAEFAEGAGIAPVTPPATSQEDAVESAGSGAAAPAAAPSGGSVNPTAPTSGFNRIPFTIEVSASSYGELSEYLNGLSEQPRLMSVVSVDSSRADTVSATIYAFAFSGR